MADSREKRVVTAIIPMLESRIKQRKPAISAFNNVICDINKSLTRRCHYETFPRVPGLPEEIMPARI